MARKLKVFRTAIGFHDAYVAAASQKAALEAWGADANLFARGAAEIVTDEALSAEPLAHPGKVIKRLRGSEEEHFAALEQSAPARAPRSRARAPAKSKAPAPATKKPRPRPDRGPLDAAQDALETAERVTEEVARTFRAREQALAGERRDAEREASEATRKARSTRDREKDRYERALERWRG